MLHNLHGYEPEAMTEMFIVMDPQSYRKIIKALKGLNKDDFNLMLESFDKHKNEKPEAYDTKAIAKKHYIRKDSLNNLLSEMLCWFWYGQNTYEGGYLKRLLPVKKEKESEAQFDGRYCLMWDSLMDLMIQTLDDCEYFQR
jgi:hypothetical protein